MNYSKAQIKQMRLDLMRDQLTELARQENPILYFDPINHPKLNQKAFWCDPRKFKAVFGGNRAGKTKIGANYVVNKCLSKPNQKWRCSTFQKLSIPIQQKAIWDALPKNDLVSYAIWTDQLGFRHNMIVFANGSVIRFQTYEQGWEKFQGESLDGEWNDEEAPEEIVKEQKMRLADRNGELIRTMTPLNGITYTYEDVIERAHKDKEVAFWFFDGKYNPYISQEARERILAQFPDKEREVREKGTFLNLTSGMAYYSFSENNVIKREIFKYEPYAPIELTWDFNVDIMTVGIHQNHKGKDYLFDYVELEGMANTELLCKMIKEKYRSHKGGFIHYGDIAGKKKSTSTSWSDWAIIEKQFPGAPTYYQSIPSIHDRVTSTNARLKNGNGEIFYYICDNCIRHLSDFRRVTWEMLLKKNKAGLLTHASDGVSYMLYWKYPLSMQPTIYQA